MSKKPSFIIAICCILTACSSYKDMPEDQAARCKELKRQMVFNNPFSNAINTQEVKRQPYDMEALQRTYRDEGCE